MTQPRLAALLALGVLVLTAVVGAVGQARDAERAGVVAVDAVVLTIGPGPVARVAWRGDDGRTAVATTAVPAGLRTGETVPLWIRADGSPAPPPAGTGSAAAVVGALVAGTAAAAATLVAHRAGRARARSRDLAREWAHVEPRWSRATGRKEP